METLRVLIDTGEPCPDCGAPATVYERAQDIDELEWIVEFVECGNGCAEMAAILAATTPRPKRRRRVA